MLEQTKIRTLLKKLMKERQLTHETMATKLQVSPATVKRRLNTDDLTLPQLADFCAVFEISIYDLMDMSKEQALKTHLFTEEQEVVLSRDLTHMFIFRAILLGLSYETIRNDLQLSDKSLRKALRELEEVELLKVMPNDRLTALVHFPFKWRPGGKLETAYNERIFQSIMARTRDLMSQRESESALTQFKTFEFLLTQASLQGFCEEIGQVYTKYRNLSEMYLKQKQPQAEVVSGVLMVDRFSIWQLPKRLT